MKSARWVLGVIIVFAIMCMMLYLSLINQATGTTSHHHKPIEEESRKEGGEQDAKSLSPSVVVEGPKTNLSVSKQQENDVKTTAIPSSSGSKTHSRSASKNPSTSPSASIPAQKITEPQGGRKMLEFSNTFDMIQEMHKTFSGNCNNRYGVGNIVNARTQIQPFGCDNAPGATHFQCNYYEAREDEPLRICKFENIIVDTSKIKQKSEQNQRTQCFYVGSDCPSGSQVEMENSAVLGTCSIDKTKFPQTSRDRIVGKIWVPPYATISTSEFQSRCNSGNTVEEPVVMVSRYDTTNLYHSLEDFVQVYTLFALYNLPINGTRIVIADNLAYGPFFDAWKILFSRNFESIPRITNLSALLNGEGKNKDATEICFKKLMPNSLGEFSIVSRRVSRSDDCHRSSILRSFSEFVTESFNLSHIEPNPNVFSIVLIDRQNYNQDKWKGNTVLDDSRYIANIREVAQKCEESANNVLLQKGKSKQIKAAVKIVDFAKIPWPEQLEMIKKTDLILGVHGAGMANGVFLNGESAVMEMWKGSRINNFHYENLARWLHLSYFRVVVGGRDVSWDQIGPEFTRAVGTVVDKKIKHLS